jgi:nucleotide-binding universal stress UspA family protein
MSRPVVVGVDGSPESLAAAEWGAREAVRRGLQLHLVHTSERGPDQVPSPAANAVRRHVGQGVLCAAEKRVARTCPEALLTDEHIEGPAATVLLHAARNGGLLVLGSRGLGGFTGFLVGSVAQAVAARATRPVVLVEAGQRSEDEHLPDEDRHASLVTPYRDVVLGIDLGEACDEVIEFAFEAARLRGASLHVLHAWDTSSTVRLGPGDPGIGEGPRREEEWHGFLATVLQNWRDKYPGVEVTTTVVRGRAGTHLVRAGAGAGLLVVGRHMHDGRPGPHSGPDGREQLISGGAALFNVRVAMRHLGFRGAGTARAEDDECGRARLLAQDRHKAAHGVQGGDLQPWVTASGVGDRLVHRAFRSAVRGRVPVERPALDAEQSQWQMTSVRLVGAPGHGRAVGRARIDDDNDRCVRRCCHRPLHARPGRSVLAFAPASRASLRPSVLMQPGGESAVRAPSGPEHGHRARHASRGRRPGPVPGAVAPWEDEVRSR